MNTPKLFFRLNKAINANRLIQDIQKALFSLDNVEEYIMRIEFVKASQETNELIPKLEHLTELDKRI